MINDIANRLNEIRLYNLNFSTNENKELLDTFCELGEFVIKNFQLPNSSKDYIYRHLDISLYDDLYSSFVSKYRELEGMYNLELPLRAIECYFRWCEEDITYYELEIIMELKFLISQLHYKAGIRDDKFRQRVVSK